MTPYGIPLPLGGGIQLLQAQETCWFWACWETAFPFTVVWECPAGHRFAPGYCAAHIGLAVAQARVAERFSPDGVVGCTLCGVLMRPVLDGG